MRSALGFPVFPLVHLGEWDPRITPMDADLLLADRRRSRRSASLLKCPVHCWHVFSSSCLRGFVWIHPSYARATHALVESEGFRNSRLYVHEIRMCGIEEVVEFPLGDHAGNAQHRGASLINPSVAELAGGGGRWNRIPVGWKFVGPQDEGVIERNGYGDPGYG